MRRRTVVFLLAMAGACALVVMPQHSRAQAQDPLVGTWKFNAAKSTSTSPLPKKRDLVITQKGDEITVNVDEVSADGTAVKWSFTTKGDGTPVPVTGWEMMDTAVTTRSGGAIGKTVYSKGGKPVMESNTQVSADGKTLVITGSRNGPDGKPIKYSSHYDRQG